MVLIYFKSIDVDDQLEEDALSDCYEHSSLFEDIQGL